MQCKDGRAFFPYGWKVIAHLTSKQMSVALCPYHLQLMNRWEHRVLERMAAQASGQVQDVP